MFSLGLLLCETGMLVYQHVIAIPHTVFV